MLVIALLKLTHRRNQFDSFIQGLKKNKHIIIYGASKQGKTSLTNKHLSANDFVKVNCSSNTGIIDIYNSIARQLDIEILESVEVTNTVGSDTEHVNLI